LGTQQQAINANQDLYRTLERLAEARETEANAKLSLEETKALAERNAIEEGKVNGKTVADRDREMILALKYDDAYKPALERWLDAANGRHIAEARVECARNTVAIYIAALGSHSAGCSGYKEG
jgi:hypothetical protein